MPGPIIEELPDDYDVAAEKSSSLRRGFFSKRETPKKVEKAPEVAESASPGAEPSTERSAEVDDMPEAPSQSSGPSMGQQLQNAIAGARGKLQEASRRASQEEKALEAALGPLQARWPTSQMKEKQVKATKEIDNALAEMRMSLNDARRHRSGEERRALTELRKVAEDVVERVQKVADQASANHSKDAKELQQQTLLAFHALPFTVKLRILMAEKAVAVTLLGGAFTVGPWKSDLQRLQRRPWNQHPAPAGRPICDPAATMTPLVAKATETAMRRALAWQPWLISKVKSRVPVEPPESESEDEVPMEDLTSSRTLRRHPKSSETMTTSLDAEFARSLKANFDKVFSDLRAEKRDGKRDALISSVNPIRAETHAIPLWQLHKLARDMNMSLEKVVEAKEIFDAHDEDRSGRLSFDEITRVIETLMERQVSDDATVQQRIQSGQSKQLLNQWLRYVPQDNLDLDFEDFLLWYSCTGFMTDLLVDEKEKRIRTLAKVNGLDAMCMDRVRRSFTSFDLDRSGEVDEEEFENVLREVMNIPPHLQIPPSRIRFFWKEIDEDDSGKASFHEFLNFWLCRFGKSAGHKGQLLSIEDYYRSTRRMGAEYLDPPPELDEITEAIQAFIANLST